VAVGPAALPAVLALSAGRPNPFRSSTTIGFALPGRREVRLEVYDVAGRRKLVYFRR
jgi:hypothetical protein